jgi:hypothetical protein
VVALLENDLRICPEIKSANAKARQATMPESDPACQVCLGIKTNANS